MESSAELLYLIDTLDKDNVFGFDNKVEHSEAVQWLLFWQVSGQPNQAQMNHFNKSAPDKISCMILQPVHLSIIGDRFLSFLKNHFDWK